MDTLHIEAHRPLKQRRLRRLVRLFEILIIVGVGGYYSYCFGLLGRKSVLLQYLFQCNCPAFSEEWRYPKQMDVIVSACQKFAVVLSPSGKTMLVIKSINSHGMMSAYLLNLQTKEETPVRLPDGQVYFLNDRLLYVFVWYGRNSEGGEHIIDLTNNRSYPIQRFMKAYPGSYINGHADTVQLVSALRQVKDIYFVKNSTDTAIALMPDFFDHPQHSFFISRFDFPYTGDLNRVEPFLQENHLPYRFVPSNFPDEQTSPNGRFIARHDGIYLTATDQKIVEGHELNPYFHYYGRYFSVRGWMYDSSGAIYSEFIGPCLFEPWGLDGPGCWVEVPQPVVLLKVPENYLSSTRVP